jgi:methionyl aminopeptidase
MIAIRTEKEINLLRKANEIVAEVHATLRPMVAPGITTRELDEVAEQLILDRGAKPAFKGYHGFPASTCISVDEEVVHGIPGSRKLKKGEIVSIDVGTIYKGYYGDAAVSHPCGKIDADRKRLLKTTERSLVNAIKAARAGNYLRDIGRAVETACKKESFGVVKDFVGHGIGTQMHEEPQVPNFDSGERGPLLKVGMILAIEPMVNMGTAAVKVLKDGWTAVTADGLPSAHFEHSVVVREECGEILSRSEDFLWACTNT